MNRAADAPEPVLLVIADISGYTRYMTANARSLAHSQTIITELIHAIVLQIELPLEVAKLEGDAVFLFCRKQNPSFAWPDARRVVGERLLDFFHRFAEKLAQLTRSSTCTCHACTHIETLRLKIVVHSGEALFHRVLNFAELAGVDVIVVHRLLKNSVKADQYLLLTEPARRDVEFPQAISFAEGAETYEDLGRVKTLVYLPGGQTPAPTSPAESSLGQRFRQSWQLFVKLWFAPFTRRSGDFRNVTSGASMVGRFLFALVTAVLTPVFLPVGAVFALIHAARYRAQIHHAADCREHKADGSCCRK